MLAPVANGVEIFEGSSDVKIVALEGEMRYFDVSVDKSASLKPYKRRGLALVRTDCYSCTNSPFTLLPLPMIMRESHSSLRLLISRTDMTQR